MTDFDFLQIYINRLDRPDAQKYRLRSGLSRSEIERLGAQVGVNIPEELIAFFSFSYGATLDEYQILTIEEISNSVAALRSIYETHWIESYIPFCYVVGVGDYLVFDIQRKAETGLLVVDAFHELLPRQWKGICYGLRSWLLRMCETNFRPFWLTQ
jgi:hypothetical protein